jgi:hypothetical protein
MTLRRLIFALFIAGLGRRRCPAWLPCLPPIAGGSERCIWREVLQDLLIIPAESCRGFELPEKEFICYINNSAQCLFYKVIRTFYCILQSSTPKNFRVLKMHGCQIFSSMNGPDKSLPVMPFINPGTIHQPEKPELFHETGV